MKPPDAEASAPPSRLLPPLLPLVYVQQADRHITWAELHNHVTLQRKRGALSALAIDDLVGHGVLRRTVCLRAALSLARSDWRPSANLH